MKNTGILDGDKGSGEKTSREEGTGAHGVDEKELSCPGKHSLKVI